MYNVKKHYITYKDSYFYNSNIAGGEEFEFYELSYAFGGNMPYGETTDSSINR